MNQDFPQARIRAMERAKKHLPEILKRYGIMDPDSRKPVSCISPDHRDSTPSMSYKRSKNLLFCFGCGKPFDIFDVVSIQEGRAIDQELIDHVLEMTGEMTDEARLKKTGAKESNESDAAWKKWTSFSIGSEQKKAIEEASQAVKEEPDPEEPARLEHIKRCQQDLWMGLEYLNGRGLSDDLIKQYGLGYDQSDDAIVFPLHRNHYQHRRLNPKDDTGRYRFSKGGTAAVFAEENLYRDAPKPRAIFIVEGAIDALSVMEAGYTAVGIPGAQNQGQLRELIEKSRPIAPLIVAFDADQATNENIKKAQEGLILFLQLNGIPHYELKPDFYPEGVKDMNDYLRLDFFKFAKALGEVEDKAAAEWKDGYSEDFGVAQLAARFESDLRINREKPIPTCFPKLNELMDGGLWSGLHVLGATSSMGKTSLVLQLADELAASGNDVLYLSLEMSRRELVAKSISRLTKQLAPELQLPSNYAKTIRGVTDIGRWDEYREKETYLIRYAISHYTVTTAQNFFIAEGMGDIGIEEINGLIEKHRIRRKRTPIVVIDYLQLLAPPADRKGATDKQILDKNILELKRISRDYRIPVIAISSLNRSSYSTGVLMGSFKESGAIEYSADVVMGLEFTEKVVTEKLAAAHEHEQNQKSRKERKISLSVIKNRNGKTGESVKFIYHSLFNLFEEA